VTIATELETCEFIKKQQYCEYYKKLPVHFSKILQFFLFIVCLFSYYFLQNKKPLGKCDKSTLKNSINLNTFMNFYYQSHQIFFTTIRESFNSLSKKIKKENIPSDGLGFISKYASISPGLKSISIPFF
jgi:hypothetical protein